MKTAYGKDETPPVKLVSDGLCHRRRDFMAFSFTPGTVMPFGDSIRPISAGDTASPNFLERHIAGDIVEKCKVLENQRAGDNRCGW